MKLLLKVNLETVITQQTHCSPSLRRCSRSSRILLRALLEARLRLVEFLLMQLELGADERSCSEG